MQDASFDPYQTWFGIPPDDQPPNHYRLLGLQRFESSIKKIEDAVAAQVEFLQAVSMGDHVEDAQRLLSEVAIARLCLVKPDRKKAYDEELRQPRPTTSQKPIPLAIPVGSQITHQQALDDLKLALQQRGKNAGSSIPQALPVNANAKTTSASVSEKKHQVSSVKSSPSDTPQKSNIVLPLVIGGAVCLLVVLLAIFFWPGTPDTPVAKVNAGPSPDRTDIEEPNSSPPLASSGNKSSAATDNKNKSKPNAKSASANGNASRKTSPTKNETDESSSSNKTSDAQPASSKKPDPPEKTGPVEAGAKPEVPSSRKPNANLLIADSFEVPLISGQSNKVPSNWIGSKGRYRANYRGMYSESSGDFTTPFGTQAAWIGYHTAAIVTDESILHEVLKANVTYTVSFNTASNKKGEDRDYHVQLLAFGPNEERWDDEAGNVLASAQGKVNTNDMSELVTFSFAAQKNNPHLGKKIVLSLEGGNQPVLFDNVMMAKGIGALPAMIKSNSNLAPDADLVLLSGNTKNKSSRDKVGKNVIGKVFWTPGTDVQIPAPFKAVTGDLLETSLAEITRDNGAAFNQPDWHNGVTDVGTGYDVSGRHGENGVEIHLDVSERPEGYDVAEIRIFTAGKDTSAANGTSVSQSLTLFYQLAKDAGSHEDSTFIKLGDILASPEGAATTGGILMTGSYNDQGNALLKGISAIKLATNKKNINGRDIFFTANQIQEIDILEYSGVDGQVATLTMRSFHGFRNEFDLPSITETKPTKIDDLTLDESLKLNANLYFADSWATPPTRFKLRTTEEDERKWVVTAQSIGSESDTDIASLYVDRESMYFQWLDAAKKNPASDFLRNGIVDFSTAKSRSHRLNLRTPKLLEPLKLGEQDFTAKQRTELEWVPGGKDLKIRLLPISIGDTETVVDPGLVTNRPAKLFFSKDGADRLIWLDLDGDVRSGRLKLDADLKIMSLPDRRNKTRPLPFDLKVLNKQIETLNQAIKDSEQTIAAVKDANQKKGMQAVVNRAKKSLAIFQACPAIATALQNKGIPIEIYYEFDGHRVVVARTQSIPN